MTPVSSSTHLLQWTSFVMTEPTFRSHLILVTGWVFARRGTVTRMILAADAVGTKHHSAFHRVFAAARWSLDALGLAIIDLIVPWLGETVFLAINDTLARKYGLKVFGVRMHNDPLISTRKVGHTNWGHSWGVLGGILQLPFHRDRFFCLPILFRLYVNNQTAQMRRLARRTRPELAVTLLHVLCSPHQQRRFHTIADSAYGGKSVYLNLPDHRDLTSRLDLDARLYQAAPPREPGANGRPRRRSSRLPASKEMPQTRSRRITLDTYGRRDRSRVAEQTAYLYAMPDRPIRVVAVEPLTGGRRIQAFYSTQSAAPAEQVLTWDAMRWSIEEAFQNSKGRLGFEEPPGWTRRAVERTAPTAMLLYTLIVLWFASEGHRHYQPPHRPWYLSKTQASFADMLATVQKLSIEEEVSSPRLSSRDRRNVVNTITRAFLRAA